LRPLCAGAHCGVQPFPYHPIGGLRSKDIGRKEEEWKDRQREKGEESEKG